MNIKIKSSIILISLLVSFSASLTPVSSGLSEVNDIELDATKLVIATRHESVLYNKIAAAFAASEYGARVGITDPNDIKFYNPSTFDTFLKTMTNAAIGADIGWGGGPTLFNNLASQNAIGSITNSTLLDIINNAVPDQIAGANMKEFDDNGDMIWASSAISSFGFTVNHDELTARGLPVPTTWEDLASPEFFATISKANLGMGNAPDTTSNTRIYQIILQKYGWDKGWEMIYRMAGNAKIYGGSVETRSSVISGETAVALTIDFYGLIAQQENPKTEYIVPINGSIVNGDPIAFAKNPVHPDAANAFFEFVYTQDAQAILLDEAINRFPVRADAFDSSVITRPDIAKLKALYTSTLNNKGITFNETLALEFEETMRYHFEYTITNAAVNSKLKSTWETMVNGYKQNAYSLNRFNQLAEQYGRPSISQDEAIAIEPQMQSDSSFRLSKQTDWETNKTASLDRALEMVTEPEIIESTIESTIETVINGTTSTLITTYVSTTTSQVSSVSQTYTDVPFSVLSMFMGLFSIVVIVFKLRKKNY